MLVDVNTAEEVTVEANRRGHGGGRGE